MDPVRYTCAGMLATLATLFGLLTLNLRPWKESVDNSLDIMAQLALNIVCVWGVVADHDQTTKLVSVVVSLCGFVPLFIVHAQKVVTALPPRTYYIPFLRNPPRPVDGAVNGNGTPRSGRALTEGSEASSMDLLSDQSPLYKPRTFALTEAISKADPGPYPVRSDTPLQVSFGPSSSQTGLGAGIVLGRSSPTSAEQASPNTPPLGTVNLPQLHESSLIFIQPENAAGMMTHETPNAATRSLFNFKVQSRSTMPAPPPPPTTEPQPPVIPRTQPPTKPDA
eukprot:NODE_4153_length_1108_cov_79.029442_g3956_i0.p1 GENE.NODE_4153_length_1108_cov_79.029442_g3956_i0~~NODE_4153_length_1108_cov_79.029442_g3956_i0.p1  ORF type:complete len:308 (+),score=55.04 NODE_4153_length_1108_cov_79.029442_g3956_i0:87-926(+)